MNLKYFTIEEMCKSSEAKSRGISNMPTPKQEEKLRILIFELLDPIRSIYGRPIVVSSGYRSEALNNAIGGSKASQHCKCQAADLQCSNINELWEICKQFELDQCIFETDDRSGKLKTWIHISYDKGNNRRKYFKMHNGKTTK